MKCGSNTDLGNKTPNVFSSSLIYNDILDYLKTNNHSSYYSDNYILTNVKYLDSLVLENSGNDTNESRLDGIEYFTNTNLITIKNYNLTDITAFKYLNNSNLDILNLSNDSITSVILSTNIYNLRLKTLDLSRNNLGGISSFKGIFFRTITNLNLSNCKLKTITGLDNVVYIEELNISNNNIDHFECLKNLEYLKNVYLYNNTLDTNTNNYYGTDGLVNKVVYYWIYKTSNVNVYVTESDIFSFTGTEETRLLHLNAIVIPTRMSSAEKTTLTSSLTSAGFSVISFTDTQDDSTHGRLVVSYTLDNTTSYREFYYEVIS